MYNILKHNSGLSAIKKNKLIFVSSFCTNKKLKDAL